MNYYVMARTDEWRGKLVDGNTVPTIEMGKYALVTSRPFVTFECAETYAAGIAPSREPKILMEVTALPAEDDPKKDVFFGMNDTHY